MDTITGIISRVRKDDGEGKLFLLVEQETPHGLVPIMLAGTSRSLGIGDAFRAEGVMRSNMNKFTQKMEPLFQARVLCPDLPTTEAGAVRYLKGLFNLAQHGIAAESVERLVSTRGCGVLNQAAADPGIILSLSANLPKFRGRILAEWSARTSARRAVSIMEDSGLDPDLIQSVLQAFPDNTYGVIQQNPYMAAPLPSIGFGNADKIGRHMGIDPDDNRRIVAALGEVLRKREGTGSTAERCDVFLKALSANTGLDAVKLRDFTFRLANEEDSGFKLFKMSDVQDLSGVGIGRKVCYEGESRIARGVSSLLSKGARIPESMARAAADNLFSMQKYAHFDVVQRMAVLMAAIEPLCVLTGGPGTGKSTVMEAFAALSEKLHGQTLFLTAPTGKAAERLAETTGRPTSTLQSLLGQQPSAVPGEPNTFRHSRENPLPSGCVVVVDEASMLDVETTAALFDAMPRDGRIVLVGDRDQLPSVGAGDVLNNLLSTRVSDRLVVPSVGLVNVYRTGKDSGIAKAAVLIRQGKVPDVGPVNINGTTFDVCHDIDMAASIEALVCDELMNEKDFNVFRDLAILFPQGPGVAGIWAVNRRLSARLNNDGINIPGVVHSHMDKKQIPLPRVGDRIMVTATEKLTSIDGEKDVRVMNGDLGFITGTVTEGGKTFILIRTDNKKGVKMPASSWRTIPLAYAITVHKSQGSQYKHVIMGFPNEAEHMMERALVYTGLTRTQSRWYGFGSRQAFETGIRLWKGDSRQTMLPALLKSMGAESFFTPQSVDWENRQSEAAAALAAASISASGEVSPFKPGAPHTPTRGLPVIDGGKIPSFLSRRKIVSATDILSGTAAPAPPVPSFMFKRRQRATGLLGRPLPVIDMSDEYGYDEDPGP